MNIFICLLKTLFVPLLISFLIIFILYHFVKSDKLKLSPSETDLDVSDYVLSLLTFTLVAVSALIFYPRMNNWLELNLPSNLYDSGLIPMITIIILCVLIELLYRLIIFFIKKLYQKIKNSSDSKKSIYILNTQEKNILYFMFLIFLFISYAYFDDNYKTCGLYLALILGKLFWLIPRFEDLRNILNSIKSLSAIFIATVLHLIEIIIFYVLYQNDDISMVMVTIGIILGLFFAYLYINKKENNQYRL